MGLIRSFLFLVFLSASPAFSDEPPLTLSALVDRALKNNPETKIAWWHAQKAESLVGVADSAFYPKIDLKLDVEDGENFKYLNGPDTEYTRMGVNLTLSLLLCDFGKQNAELKAIVKALEAANWASDFAIQKVMISVIERSLEMLEQEQAVLAAEANLAEAKKLSRIVKELHRVGLKPITDLYTAESLTFQMQLALAQKKSELNIKRAKVCALANLAVDTPLHLALVEEVPENKLQQLEELITLAKQKRKDLLAKRASVAEKKTLLEKEQYQDRPTLTFSSAIGSNRYLHDHTKEAQYRFGLTLDVPLFSGFSTLYKCRAASSSLQIDMEELAKLELEIAQEVLTSVTHLESAYAMLPVAKDNLHNAERAYDGVQERYRAGKQSITDVGVAHNQLTDARTQHYKIHSQLLVATSQLAYATGTL